MQGPEIKRHLTKLGGIWSWCWCWSSVRSIIWSICLPHLGPSPPELPNVSGRGRAPPFDHQASIHPSHHHRPTQTPKNDGAFYTFLLTARSHAPPTITISLETAKTLNHVVETAKAKRKGQGQGQVQGAQALPQGQLQTGGRICMSPASPSNWPRRQAMS